MGGWTTKAGLHSLGHNMIDGLFARGPCAYCGLDTIDFCPACGVFVCRQCDTAEHWPAVGIIPEVGFVLGDDIRWPRRRR
jgi:hypothetical protein